MNGVRAARWAIRAGAFALAMGVAGCGPKPLPEAGGAAELLYAGRCGQCHRPYNPRTLTAAMWDLQVDAMQIKIAQAGQAPLSEAERHTIIDYLERNAGHD